MDAGQEQDLINATDPALVRRHLQGPVEWKNAVGYVAPDDWPREAWNALVERYFAQEVEPEATFGNYVLLRIPDDIAAQLEVVPTVFERTMDGVRQALDALAQHQPDDAAAHLTAMLHDIDRKMGRHVS